MPTGWIVEAVAPAVGPTLLRRHYMFAVASQDADEAERLVRDRLGNLHCTVEARIRLAPRALAQFEVAQGMKELTWDGA